MESVNEQFTFPPADTLTVPFGVLEPPVTVTATATGCAIVEGSGESNVMVVTVCMIITV